MNLRSRIALWILLVGVSGALLWGSLHPRWDRSQPSPPGNPPLPRPPSRPNAEGELVSMEVAMMGSSFEFKVEGELENATQALQAAIERVRKMEDEISEWRPGSDMSRLNGAAGIEPVKVGEDTFGLLTQALKYHAMTEGAFDVTIGPVWNLWPYHDPNRPLPTEAQITEALRLVDGSRIQLNPENRTAYLPVTGMRVNSGAIGKGYAAQAAIDVMRRFGIKRAAVSAGGDLFLLGRRSDGPWVVGIENPQWTDQIIERFEAGDVGVATSGDSQQRIVREGKTYNHILDPRTGYPVSECHSVTVITADPTAADAFATAIFVMGPEKGLKWAEKQQGVETLIVDAGGRIHRSKGWAKVAHPPHGRPAPTPTISPSSGPDSVQRTTPEDGLSRLRAVNLRSGTMVSVNTSLRIDRTEVTNRDYSRFLKECSHRFCHPREPAHKKHRPRYWDEFRPPVFLETPAAALAPFQKTTFTQPDNPVVGVDWWDAVAFARWAGKRLPRCAEWKEAACGTDGRIWPWGNQWDPARANSGGEMHGENDGFTYAAPADSFPQGASPCGALHMAGNVAEWTQEGAVMGGSSASNPSQVRGSAAQFREPDYRSFDLGFRCAAP